MPLESKSEAALLIVGHGSTENPDSSTPYYEHADELRKRGIFAEVHCCFWKEEPSMREAPYMIEASEIYVAPDFISEGYFTQEIIPRELGLTGPVTVRGGEDLALHAGGGRASLDDRPAAPPGAGGGSGGRSG